MRSSPFVITTRQKLNAMRYLYRMIYFLRPNRLWMVSSFLMGQHLKRMFLYFDVNCGYLY